MTVKQVKITAVVAIRNGAFYFPKLCQHARQNGFTLAIIDNDSTDNLQTLIKQNSDVIEYSTMLKYDGKFDLIKQLEAKENIIRRITTDWVIHLDVDELLYSNIENESLQKSISNAHHAGYNAINFDEFVFLPIQRFKSFDSSNYHTMDWYYFFEPKPNRLIRAFNKSLKTDVRSGGHNVAGDLKLFPQSMIMRHYMFENRKHAKVKYRDRLFTDRDLEHNFHKNRVSMQGKQLFLPAKKKLSRVLNGQWVLDKIELKTKHFWEW